MRATYLHGLDTIAAPKRVIRVQIGNAAALGAKAYSALDYLPEDAVEALVYREVASQIETTLKEKGARVKVDVVESLSEPSPVKDGLRDILVGALGGLGAGLGIWAITRRMK